MLVQRNTNLQVEEAYARMLGVDVLGTTASTTATTAAANSTTSSSIASADAAWAAAQQQYEQRTDRVEERVARLLCERLRAARTADEMFRAVGRFNALFVRPRIRAAIAQFQQDLLAHVRAAVQALAEKFTQR
jgi:Dynein heavy chain, N-terminal region 1